MTNVRTKPMPFVCLAHLLYNEGNFLQRDIESRKIVITDTVAFATAYQQSTQRLRHHLKALAALGIVTDLKISWGKRTASLVLRKDLFDAE